MNAQDQKISKEKALITSIQPKISAASVTIDPWEYRTIISNIRKCFIEILHNGSDPSVWIVRRWKKILWFKKRISSDWFINKQQAFAFASEMKRQYKK